MSAILGELPPLRDECRLTVAIPARNEAGTMARTLEALHAQRTPLGKPLPAGTFDVVIFANGCSDETAAVVRRFAAQRRGIDVSVVEGDLPAAVSHVGTARRCVMDAAAERFLRARRAGGIVATTDADTVVDPEWAAWTLSEIQTVDAVAGYVTLDAAARDALVAPLRVLYLRELAYRRAFAALEAFVDPLPHDPAPRHASFVGASFAVRATAYRAAGGVPPEPFLEDRAFFRALRRIDARVRHSLRVRAATSSRRAARVAGGFGSFLSALERCAAGGTTFTVEDPRASVAEIAARGALRRVRSGAADTRDTAVLREILGRWPLERSRGLTPDEPFGRACERLLNAAPALPQFCVPTPVEEATAVLQAALAAAKAAAPTRPSAASGAG